MGKHFNAEQYRQLERQTRQRGDDDLSEEQRAAEWDQTHYDRIKAEVEYFARPQ